MCLKKHGLVDTALISKGVWRGRALGGFVFVDGPYRTAREADGSAKSLTPVEDAERGGRYVVSAVLRDKQAVTVHKVANCLNNLAPATF